MKKVLLSLAAVGVAMSANAQLLNYGFETEDILPGELVTENWTNFANSQFDLHQAESGVDGTNSLWVSTDVTCNPWERVVAFTNTGIKENTSYRISLWVKGKGNFNVALLKGCFNHDQALQAGHNDTFIDQTKTFTAEDESNYVRYSYVVWSPSRDIMKAKKSDFAEDEYWNQDFLRLAFTGIGTFNVDDVKIEESAVSGITYNNVGENGVIKVKFGYDTNAATLAEKAGGTKEFDKSVVTVKVDDEEIEVLSVEIKNTGDFYIFTADEIEGDVVTVSFKNPGELTYSSNVAPECWTKPYAAVYDFTDEVALLDENLDAYPMIWEPANLVTSNPSDDAFEIENGINTFTFTFNKAVAYTDDNVGTPIAKLTGKDFSEDLVLEAFEGFQETLTFKRSGTTPLANGEYVITVNNVANEKGRAIDAPVAITFEVGEVVVGYTEYTEIESVTGGVFSEGIEGNYPSGWTLTGYAYEGDADSTNAIITEDVKLERIRTAEGGFGGSRGRDLTSSTVPGAIYMRNLNWSHKDEGNPVLYYGNMEGYPFTLSGDSVCIRFYVHGWENGACTFRATLYADAINGQEVVASLDMASTGSSNSLSNREFDQYEMFVHPNGEHQYFLRVELVSKNSAGLFGGFKVFNYVKHEGDNSKDIEFVKSFDDTDDNKAPKAGSGWRIYANGNMKTPGGDYNYNGSRIFNLGYKSMKKGFYCGMGGNASTDYIIYGEGVTYDDGNEETVDPEEPILHLPAAKLQVSFYRINWKTNAQTHTLQIIDKNTGDIVLERKEKTENVLDEDGQVVISVNPSGQRNAGGNVDALKTEFSWFVPYEGDFLAKMFIDGEGFVSPLSIKKIGSKAIMYKKALKTALTEAEDELALAMSDDQFVGETRDNLAAQIKFLKEAKLHTPQEYNEGMDELASLVRAMAARRNNITNYPTKLASLKEIVDNNAENKYAALDAYKDGVNIFETYNAINPVSLNDKDLAKAVTTLDNQIQLLNNMINTCVGLLTQQLADLSAKIIALDDNLVDNEAVLAVNVAIADDQKLVKGLKLLYTGTLYKQIAAGKDFFQTYNEDIEEYLPDSLELNCMIQNRGFYSTAKKNAAGEYVATTEDFPGWNIVVNENRILSDWGWNGAFQLNDVFPYADAALCTGYGTSKVNVSQLVSDIPVGIYTIGIQVGDGTKKTEDSLSTAYMIVADTIASLKVANDEGGRNALTYAFYNVTPDVDAEAKTASYTVGATLMSRGDFSKCDNATLVMTGKLEGFDYAAAADVVLEAAKNGLDKVVERTDAPVAVSYFNMAGQEVAAPQGASLKIERYSDGYTVVKKVLVK